MIKSVFVTVTDYSFFPGTLATVNSILVFHPDADIYVIENEKNPLTSPQRECFKRASNVKILMSSVFEREDRFINAWELKAYAAYELSAGYDVLVGIDGDCILCSNVEPEIEQCLERGSFMGGKDGDGPQYDETYSVYGISPQHNPKYMSTSLYFVAINDANRRILKRWTETVNKAIFNGTGLHPGHGDQGVLNAVLFAEDGSERVLLLENALWSQHWTYWDSIIDFRDDKFVNVSANEQIQRAFHCGGTDKYWNHEHRDKILENQSLQTYPYAWFLAMLWFGKCSNWDVDPYQYLPPNSHHLVEDLPLFFTQISTVYSPVNEMWNNVTDVLLNRTLNGIHRMLSLGGGSMSELIELITLDPKIHRYVEIGSYLGGSLFTLALRFMNRDVDFFAVESFMGNLNGTMDGHALPSRKKYMDNLARFPSLRTHLVVGDSKYAVNSFDEESVGILFVDGCHDTPAVLDDIDTWLPKISKDGIIAGDDYGWQSVSDAVKQRFSDFTVSRSESIWWAYVSDYISVRV